MLNGLVFQNTYSDAIDMNSSTPAHDITIQNRTFQYIGKHVETADIGMNGVYAGEGHYNLTFNANTFSQIGRTGGQNLSHDHGFYLHSSNPWSRTIAKLHLKRASGDDERDERKRSADEASKQIRWHQNWGAPALQDKHGGHLFIGHAVSGVQAA